MLNAVFFLAAVAGGAFVQAASGFGFGIFVMMFFPLCLPNYGMCVTLSGLLSIGTTVVTTIQYRQYIAWRKLLIPSICFCVISAVIITIAAGQADSLMKRLLGGALILLSMYFLFLGKNMKIHATPAAGVAAGSLSGLLSGLFSIGGPPMVVYLLAGTDSKEEYLATIQAYFTVTNLFTLAVRAMNGMVTKTVFSYAALGLVGIALGVFLGRKVFRKLDANRLRFIVYLFMAASGVITLVKG